ncbi:hypothetical protein [Sediminibacillus albus]|uniref:Permuted papain-like amidase enzyme, YaeF/YiiX, C92 family n=1 Tax=Sediminibacillus albus TaxID=407036 RepID=A0A1G8YQ04_9BACI|nr:hypothetical protein SAMN05216243_1758 [Sediminibacillus albus]
MQTVYIVLTNTGSLINWAIKTVTDAPYNHASIALDKDLRRIYSFARREPLNPLWGGFVKEDLEKGTFSWYPDTTCAIFQLTISDREYQKLERLIAVFEKRAKRYLYNYAGLVGIPINYPIEVPASFFCSQFVAEVLRRAGHPLFNKPSSLVTPDDFREHKELELVYEGELYQYPALYSQEKYQPKKYHHFPFRKYMMQQIDTEVLRLMNRSQKQYYFRDGFLKPKKIYLTGKISKVKNVKKLWKVFID